MVHRMIQNWFQKNAEKHGVEQHTVDELVTLKLSPQSEVMTLNVVRRKGKLFAMNNRRLWCLKEYASSRQLSCQLNRRHVFVRVSVWPLARGALLNKASTLAHSTCCHEYTGSGSATDWAAWVHSVVASTTDCMSSESSHSEWIALSSKCSCSASSSEGSSSKTNSFSLNSSLNVFVIIGTLHTVFLLE